MSARLCRSCGSPLNVTFADLGVSPLSNSYVPAERADEMEPFYPLHAYVCERCLLVQVQAFEAPEHIFTHYAYFSSYSESWLEHSRRFAHDAIARLDLRKDALVMEAASNDGYLLQYFRERGLPVAGIEPARNIAAVARERGVPTESVFLGEKTGRELREKYGCAALVVANNVIGHVPDLHDFVNGLETLMGPGGTLTVEIPHLLHLIAAVQFDTIYHEHFSYYSLHAMERLLHAHGLRIWSVEPLPTHGGSLRYWIVREDDERNEEPSVSRIRDLERSEGLCDVAVYRAFGERVARRKRDVLRFFLQAADEGRTVAGYGAPAKGNTLLNYCGIRPDMLRFTVDRNPEKQGTLLPGSRIPVFPPERLAQARPGYVLILPWNLREEIVRQIDFIREWGGKFVVVMPQVEIF